MTLFSDCVNISISKNIFGDITDIYYGSTRVASYKYDAWGNCTVENFPLEGTDEDFSIGNLNPFRYRGYYWCEALQMYHLQTRWYDPTIGRFISPDSYEYLAPETTGGLNLYAYCLNNPIMYYDPSGCFSIDTIVDIASVFWSAYDLIKNPSWKNAGWLALDIVFALVPALTSNGIIHAASKLDEVSYIGQGMNRFDDLYDTVVLGNDINRVMDRAFDIGATFYSGYWPLNALESLHDFENVTEAMQYAAKLDNARFIIDKVNDGYKFVHVGSDGRSFFKMMKSAYGMELKILYRLKIGNKLHRFWWIINSGRRIIW